MDHEHDDTADTFEGLELDEICLQATMTSQHDRYDNTRELAAAVDAFLDGDRDQEVRTKLSQTHVALAAEKAGEALADKGGPRPAPRAMNEVGLALDPNRQKRPSPKSTTQNPADCAGYYGGSDIHGDGAMTTVADRLEAAEQRGIAAEGTGAAGAAGVNNELRAMGRTMETTEPGERNL